MPAMMSPERGRTIAGFTLACLALLIGGSHARAYEWKRLAIELQASRQELPKHVCVIHDRPAAAVSETQRERCNTKYNTCRLKLRENVPRKKGHTRLTKLFDYVTADDNGALFVEPSNKKIRGPDEERPAVRALQAMSKPHARARCREAFCDPRVHLRGFGKKSDVNRENGTQNHRRPGWMTCATNPRVSGTERVLFLEVDLPGDVEGRVERVYVDGSVVGISGEWSKRQRPVAEVIGGHYFPGDAATAHSADRMSLHIETRCVDYDVALPPTIRTRAAASARSKEPPRIAVQWGDDARANCERLLCTQSHRENCVRDAFRMTLRRDQDGRYISGRLSLQPDASTLSLPKTCWQRERRSGASESKLVKSVVDDLEELCTDVDLQGVQPVDGERRRLELRLAEARFRWSKPCEFPNLDLDASCPPARLMEPGIDCGRGKILPGTQDHERPQCAYHCPVPEDGEAFSLPVTVQFSALGQQGAWEEQLSYVDQLLTGYTPLQERRFPVFTYPKSDINRAGDQIEKVRFWTPSGRTYELEICAALGCDGPENASCPACAQRKDVPLDRWVRERERAYVTLPGATCGSPFSYQYVGDRDYEVGTTQVRDGRVEISPTHQTAVHWMWGIGLGGGIGYAWTLEDEPLRDPGWMSSWLVQWGFSYRPAGGGYHSIDVTALALFSRFPFYPLQPWDESSAQSASRSWGARFGVELATPIAFDVFEATWLFGPLMGVGLRSALYGDTARLELGGVRPYLEYGMTIRFQIARHLWLESSPRVFIESTPRFRALDGLNGGVERELEPTLKLLIPLSLRYWL